MRTRAILPVIFLTLTHFSLQDNHPPKVKFVSPNSKAVYNAGTAVSYEISVEDPEDGNSKFDEINPLEVLLEVKRITKSSKPSVSQDAPGLAVIRSSNCFNCHNFDGKSIGPSFFEIGKHYPDNKANRDSLIRRIRDGSAGIWGGKEKMPSHPELSNEEIKNTVLWILKYASQQGIHYLNGITGIIPASMTEKGTYLLTASYTDHGPKNAGGKHLRGADTISITIK